MPLTPYSVSNGSFSRKSNSFVFAPHERNIPTAMATSTKMTLTPRPAARSSEILPRPASAMAERKMITTGETMHIATASAIFGAQALRSARYRAACSIVTLRSGVSSASDSTNSSSSSSSFNK